MTKKVAIIYKYIPQYRLEFFNRLQDELNKHRVELVLIYGQPDTNDQLKKDTVDIPWATKIHNTILSFNGKSVFWQPVMKHLQGVDLVIVEQANKLLINNVLLCLRLFRNIKLAYWGHGKNFQTSSAQKVSEYIKKITSSKVDWWFAYTKRTAEIVHNNGFPKEKITIVQNAIDTVALKKKYEEINNDALHSIKETIGLKGNHVGLYVGGMYKEKKIEFLLKSCKLIREQVPDFEMIMIGSGAYAENVEKFVQRNSWLKYLGPKFGSEKAPYFALADLFLMPGLVGLAILDCFSLGTPLVTIDHSDHSPEIDYLIDNYNGILVQEGSNPYDYAKVIVALLKDESALEKLKKGCFESATGYSIERMVDNFADGVVKALN